MRLPSLVKRLAFIGLVVLIPMSTLFAMAATNTVPITGLGSHSELVDLDKLKPSECATMNLTEVFVVGNGNLKGNVSYLILGSAISDTISAKNGDNCIVGGGGGDTINGGNGNDVILGGDGDDTIDGGKGNGYDICYGGPGNDTFTNCDEVYP